MEMKQELVDYLNSHDIEYVMSCEYDFQFRVCTIDVGLAWILGHLDATSYVVTIHKATNCFTITIY